MRFQLNDGRPDRRTSILTLLRHHEASLVGLYGPSSLFDNKIVPYSGCIFYFLNPVYQVSARPVRPNSVTSDFKPPSIHTSAQLID